MYNNVCAPNFANIYEMKKYLGKYFHPSTKIMKFVYKLLLCTAILL
jgi:hypothetical protein